MTVPDPLQRRFADNCQFLIDHPPPQMMLWVLVELLEDTANMVTVLEARAAEELAPQQSTLQLPLDS